MKMRGYWGRFDAAYVDVRFVCKRFGIDEVVPFLIDLGASSTIISDKDAKNLGIDYNALQKLPRGVTGIGGRAKAYARFSGKLKTGPTKTLDRII
jgi:predicted aspartyl protease